MPEDKLTHDERLRLECLAQAIAAQGIGGNRHSAEGIISNAKHFEKYVSGEASADAG